MTVARASSKPPVLCILGATASGKTAAAMAAAQAAPCHVISVDSALVYRGMDIGTAKPTPQELAHTPHALVDICDPEDAYSAARFVDDAIREVDAAHQAGLLPILVGGTNLYFRALLHGMNDLPSADPAIRADIQRQADARGWPELHAQLAQQDPQTATRLHPNDGQRIQRALELIAQTGKPASTLLAARAEPPAHAWETTIVGVAPWPLPFDSPESVSTLNTRIAVRFAQMIDAGFVEEVAALRARPTLTADHPSMRAVGYRQLWRHLDGEISLETAVELGVIATRQFAKRQRTWLRKEPGVQWHDTAAAPEAVAELARLCVQRFG